MLDDGIRHTGFYYRIWTINICVTFFDVGFLDDDDDDAGGGVVIRSILPPPSALLDRRNTAKNWQQSLVRSTLVVKVWSPKIIWWKLWTSLWWLGRLFWSRGHQADVFCVSHLCDDARLTTSFIHTIFYIIYTCRSAIDSRKIPA